MLYEHDRQVRSKSERTKQAIALAMQSRWEEAIAVNKSIIDSFPNDVDAYNRLGKAYVELGEHALAREAYSRTMEIDPYNTIAKKNLDRLSRLEGAQASLVGASLGIEPQQFIEEVGKAGVVNLYRLAPAEVLASVAAGDKVNLKIDGLNLVVEDSHGRYLGQIELKHAQRLIRLMQGGNKYTATVTSSTEDMVKVIIREVHQHPSQAGQLSFPPKRVVVLPPEASPRISRRELATLESEEGAVEEPGYTIIGGDEVEVLQEESSEIDEDKISDEE